MKKIILVLFLFLFAGCAGWRVNGVPVNRLNTTSECLEGLAGFASSMLIHTASHLLYAELVDADWKIEGTREVLYSELTDNEWQWFARAGFVGQLAVGTIIKLTPLEDRPFATGYHIGSATEIITYPMRRRDHGDLYEIDNHGGNWKLEYLGYSAYSILLMTTNKEPKEWTK